MSFHLNDLSVSPLELVVRAVVVYLSILILLRLSGKRQIGQMGPTEFVAILLISNAVQNAMNGGDDSLTAGLILAPTLIFMSWLISYLTFKSKKASLLFEGAPTLLIHRGEVIKERLEHERLTTAELKSLLRKQGISRIADVHSAVLEADGSLSVTHVEDLKHSS